MKRNNILKAPFLPILFVVLVVGILAAITINQGLSVVPAGNVVFIPKVGYVECGPTRIACTGSPNGECSDTSPIFQTVKKGGEYYSCGAPTISDANYYDGCKLYIQSEGKWDWLSSTSVKVCNSDGTNCQHTDPYPTTAKWTGQTKVVDLRAGQKAFVNPSTITSVTYYMQGRIYGIRLLSDSGNAFSDRCDLGSLLTKNQLSMLKSDPSYAKYIVAGTINPGNPPISFIYGYGASYSNTRVITRGSDSYFVQQVGLICKIEQATDGRYVVTDNCKEDTTVQCIPNIANCDKDGKLMTSVDNSQKACVPGTLIGSSTTHIPISQSKACLMRCSSSGIPENYDCKDIVACKDGKVLNENYECVDSTKLTDKVLCETTNGQWITNVAKDGAVTTSCQRGTDNTLLYVAIGVVVLVVIMLAVKMRLQKR
jgi:hypothetical protein